MRRTARTPLVFTSSLLFALIFHGIPADAATQFERAKPQGKAGCPAGTFLDIGRGDCWSCPKNHDRTLFFAVDTPQACEWPAHLDFKYAKKQARGKGLLLTDCPRGQFVDWNGYCYSCPRGYDRTAFFPVTVSKACARPVAPVYTSAKKAGDFCPKGTFLDIGRGDCWSCRADWYRTVNPVDGAKACTNEVGGIFAVDSSAMCTQVVTALREGEKGVTRLMGGLGKTIEPLMQPVNESMRKLSDQISTPAELDKVIDRFAKSLRPYSDVMDEVQRLSNQIEKTGDQLRSLLLDPKVVCEGNLAQLDRRLATLGLRPNLRPRKSGLLDDLLVGNAHAATKGVHVAFPLSIVLPLTLTANTINSIVFTYVTNFDGERGLFLSFGRLASEDLGLGASLGFYIFPYTDMGQFEGFNALAAEVVIGAEEIIKKFGSWRHVLPESVSITFNPLVWQMVEIKDQGIELQSLPGIGRSWDVEQLIRRAAVLLKKPAPASGHKPARESKDSGDAPDQKLGDSPAREFKDSGNAPDQRTGDSPTREAGSKPRPKGLTIDFSASVDYTVKLPVW